MKKRILIVFCAFVATSAIAQTDTTQPEKPWKHSGLYNVGVTQTALINWAAGGSNTTNATFLLKQAATYNKGKHTWFNLLEYNLGYNFQPAANVKSDDKIELTTRYDRDLSDGDWSASAYANARTQLFDGFSNPEDSVRISAILSPAYATYGLGFTNKSVKGLNIYVSPLTVKNTFVIDSALSAQNQFFDLQAPNVSALAKGAMRWELGAFAEIIYAQKVTESFEITSKLSLFSNYLDRPQNIDVTWEALFMFKATKFLTATVLLNLIYDHDIKIEEIDSEGNSTSGPKVQFKQIFGAGLSFTL